MVIMADFIFYLCLAITSYSLHSYVTHSTYIYITFHHTVYIFDTCICILYPSSVYWLPFHAVGRLWCTSVISYLFFLHLFLIYSFCSYTIFLLSVLTIELFITVVYLLTCIIHSSTVFTIYFIVSIVVTWVCIL